MRLEDVTLDRLLRQVQKPARYVGQEWNSVVKQGPEIQVRLALAYPDLYEIGMSNLGLAILYDVVNRDPRFSAERVYVPWGDMSAALRASKLPLYTLETRTPLRELDVLGVTLQYELTYTNVLEMLDLAGIPIWAAERDETSPLVIAGGSGALNPEPMAPFFDLFVLGEGEEVLLELLGLVAEWKAQPRRQRSELLRAAAQIDGIYVPSLYAPEYGADGALSALRPLAASVPPRVRKRILSRLGPTPTQPIVPNIETVHDRATIEIQRGCSRGCRFCQAGMIYRPIRERPADEALAALDALLACTGYDEVGLVSLSSSDYSQIGTLVAQAMERHRADGLAVSLPSLRIDSFSVELAEQIESRRKTGFTFAPEAGSQRLRDVINKGVTEEDLLRTAEAAFSRGWQRLKLYFMLGLPTETDEDAHEIARLVRDLRDLGRRMRGRRVELSVSLSTFVPKPHTPFQWEPLVAREAVERRQAIVREGTRSREVHVSWSEWDSTWLEAVLSRADRRAAQVIHAAWRAGARFDAWGEHLHPELWAQAMADGDFDPAFFAARRRGAEEAFPWEMADVGVTRAYLWHEYERALAGALSPDCRAECHQCGVLQCYAAERRALPVGAWGCP